MFFSGENVFRDPHVDVEDVKYVINFDYPSSSEDYIHRIGRTGRNKQTGTAYAFFTPQNVRHAGDLISVLTEANQNINPQLAEMAVLYKTGSMLPKAFGKKNKNYGSSESRYNQGKTYNSSDNYNENTGRNQEVGYGFRGDGRNKFGRVNPGNRDQRDNVRNRYAGNFNTYKPQKSYSNNVGYNMPQTQPETGSRYPNQQMHFAQSFNFSQPPPPPPLHSPTTFSQQTPLSIY